MKKKTIGRILGIAMLLTGVMFVIALAHVSAQDTEAPAIIDGTFDIEGTTGENVTVWVQSEDNVNPTNGIVRYKKVDTVDWIEENMTRTKENPNSIYLNENNALIYDSESKRIDISHNAAPTFIDLDGDSDLDMVIGEWYGRLFYYENIGDSKNPIWERHNEMFSGIDVGGFSSPAFVDMDDDGDSDMVVGIDTGKLRYYENTGNANIPAWTERDYLEKTTGVDIDVGDASAPTFTDLDDDGDYDLIIGEESGIVNYYVNNGNKTNPQWLDQGSFEMDVGYNSTPILADLDNDGDYDLLIGAKDGYLVYYRNIGNSTDYIWEKDTRNFTGIDIGKDSVPALADLDNDGDLDLMIGTGGGRVDESGKLEYYENMNIYKFEYTFELASNDVTNLYYSIHIYDDENNVVHYPEESPYPTITIVDTENPTIIDGSGDLQATTGDEIKVWVEAQDNIEAYVGHLFYDESTIPINMEKETRENSIVYFYYNILVDFTSDKDLEYNIKIVDEASNIATYKNKTLSDIPTDYIIYVTDNDPPEIIGGIGNITWGDEENITIWIHSFDNIELGDAQFYYKEDDKDGEYTSIIMDSQDMEDYTNFSYVLDKIDNDILYYINVTDVINNNASYGNETSPYKITLDKVPEAYAGDDQMVYQAENGGILVKFNASMTTDDLPGELYYMWNFSDMEAQDNILEGFDLTNPEHIFNNPGEYNVILNVTDTGNNSNEDIVIITVLPFVQGSIDIEEAFVSLQGSEIYNETYVTDGKYRFDISPGRYMLHANAPHFYDFNKEIYVLENKNKEQNIDLKPIFSNDPDNTYVEGWVKNEDGGRIEGAKVSIIDYQDPNNPFKISNVTGKAGRFWIYGYGGNFKLVCEHMDYKIFTQIIKIKAGEPLDVNVTLEPKETYILEVTVKNQNNETISGANVTVSNFKENFEITNQTNDQGVCNINVYNGSFTLKAGYPGYFNLTTTVTITGAEEEEIKIKEIPEERDYIILGEVWYNEPLEGANITLYDIDHYDYTIKTQTLSGSNKGYFEMNVYHDSVDTKNFILIVDYPGLQSSLKFITLQKGINTMEIERIDLENIMQDEINTTIEFDDWNNSNVAIKQTLNANIGMKRFDIDRLFGNGDGDLTSNEVTEWNEWLKDLGGDKLDTKNDFKVNGTYFEVVEDSYQITISNAAELITSNEPIIIEITYDVTSTAGKGEIEINATFDTLQVDYIINVDLPDDYEVISHFSVEPANISYPVLDHDVIINPLESREEDPQWGGPALPPINPFEWITLHVEMNIAPIGDITVNESLDMVQDDEYYVVQPGKISFSGNQSSDIFMDWLEFEWIGGIGNETIGTLSYVIYDFTETGYYDIWLKLVDNMGADSWTNKTVIVDNEAPEVKITVVDEETDIDEGEEIAFNGNDTIDEAIDAYPGGLYNYSWEFGDSSYENDTIANNSYMNTTYSYDNPGTYKVNLTVWDNAGNSGMISVDITIKDITKPIAKFDYNETVEVNEIATFNATNSSDPEDGTINKYSWDFGDGNNDTGALVTHAYEEDGEFNVILNITDSSGNWKTIGQTILVEEIPTPDFGVMNITFSDPNPKDGEKITINATVYLHGDVEITDNVTVKFYYYDESNNPVFIEEMNVSLELGEDKVVTINWTATKDAYGINVTIDEAGETSDTLLENNKDSKEILIGDIPDDTNWGRYALIIVVVIILIIIGYRFVLTGKSSVPDKGKSKKGKK